MRNKQIDDEITRSEVNLLIYPFFSLNESRKKTKKIEFKNVISREGKKFEITWSVHPHSDYGTPTIFDKKIYIEIMAIIDNLPKPISNPICIGSTYSLLKKTKTSTNESN